MKSAIYGPFKVTIEGHPGMPNGLMHIEIEVDLIEFEVHTRELVTDGSLTGLAHGTIIGDLQIGKTITMRKSRIHGGESR